MEETTSEKHLKQGNSPLRKTPPLWQKKSCSVDQLNPTLWDSMDYSPPGFSLHGIPQARILEWVAISSPEDLPNPGTELESLVSPALAGGFFTTEPPGNMAESEDELRTFLMKVKGVSEKYGLKFNSQKTKIMASGPITSWQIDGETNENRDRLYFLGLQNHWRWQLQPWN